MRGQARAAIVLENLEHLFALAEAVEHRRDGPDVQRVRAQPEQVAGYPVQLGEYDPRRLRPRRRFHVQQLFHGQAVAQAVRDGRHVVHAVHVGVEHLVGAVLGDLFHPSMQVADDALGPHHLFSVEFQNHAQHAVRGRVLWTHIEN